ncbi:nucleolar and spindle-associated protein 1 [Austrofundulus limnaeus]|uniref:Nucleolar and spindle-associated protein 1 n=1 Tax=Austrofundulus limnaeus TaxID=52670 RepID=A0A2I4AKZ8_AUSLI|nr:PREDICTED: nucleolar and spindle-associated protein 1-like [Austrofundulus limnaeus]
MDLDSMKYSELRSLAKELGLKANGKADKLLKAIKHHYDQEKLKDLQDQDPVEEEDKNQVCEETAQDVCNVDMFVTTRRGKDNTNNRKLNDPAADCDLNITPEDGEKHDAQNKPCSAQGKKKRKLSSEQTASEAQSGRDQQPCSSQDQAPAGKEPKVLKGGRIPRYQRLHQKNKTNTPNFKKIHEAQFNKMESIETYVQRRTKQKETNRNSAKDLKESSDTQRSDVKAGVKTNLKRASMFSPVPVRKKPAEERGRRALQNKTTGKDVSFRPSLPFPCKTSVRCVRPPSSTTL